MDDFVYVWLCSVTAPRNNWMCGYKKAYIWKLSINNRVKKVVRTAQAWNYKQKIAPGDTSSKSKSSEQFWVNPSTYVFCIFATKKRKIRPGLKNFDHR